uniref:RING-type E3 ubiquitin transferase n=1 Tax=Salix viminalis TaxID=40686 RepID=A0A6N2JYM2_SALVM
MSLLMLKSSLKESMMLKQENFDVWAADILTQTIGHQIMIQWTAVSNDHIQGTIESTGEKIDPLYFEPLSFSAVSYYRQHSRESIWRMDLEIVMSLISNTLVCVFVGCQILYVKKHPAVSLFHVSS